MGESPPLPQPADLTMDQLERQKDRRGGDLGQGRSRKEGDSSVKQLGGNSYSRLWGQRWEGLASHAWGGGGEGEVKLHDPGN